MLMGIDPGASGGVAVLYGSGKLIVEPMPATLRDLWCMFNEERAVYSNEEACFAVMEQVHAMPKQGVSSTFTFGRGVGRLEMALTAADIPYESVTPRKWQKELGIQAKSKDWSNTQWKNHLKEHAQRLYPEQKITLKTADALLILEYARRTVNR